MSAKKAPRVTLENSTNHEMVLNVSVFEMVGDVFSRENKPHTARWTASEARDLAARLETLAGQIVSAAAEAEYVTARNQLHLAFHAGAIPDSAPPTTAPVHTSPLRMRSANVRTYGKVDTLPAYSPPVDESILLAMARVPPVEGRDYHVIPCGGRLDGGKKGGRKQ